MAKRRPKGPLAFATLVALAATLAGGTLSACTPAAGTNNADPLADPFATGVTSGPTTEADTAESGEVLLDLRRGRGVLRIAHLPANPVPDSLLLAFRAASGFTVEQVEVATPAELASIDADLVVGLDTTDTLAAASALSSALSQDAAPFPDTALVGAPTAIAYGRDDVCVMADTSWYSANNIPVPATIDEVGAQAGRLAVPDPASTAQGRAFAQFIVASKGEGATAFSQALRGGGALVATDVNAALAQWSSADLVAENRLSATSGATTTRDGNTGADSDGAASSGVATTSLPVAGGRPLLVWSQSLATLARDNTGSQSAAAPVAGTCVRRILHAAPLDNGETELSDATEAFLEMLTSNGGQVLVARAAWAYPLDEAAATATAAQWFLTPDADALALPEAVEIDPKAALATW